MPPKIIKQINGSKVLKNPYALLSIIVLFGFLLRLAFFSGMGISDSLAYSKAANDLNNAKGINPDSALTLSTRIGIIYATALSYRIFGINDFSSVLFPIITSLAGIILIFYFGKLLFNEKAGLLAACLLSFFPLDVAYSTQLLSDLPSAFFMSLGVYVFLYAELKKSRGYGLSCLLSGILIGIGYMIRESALLIALFFIAYLICKKKLKREYFLVPLGVIIIFALESLVFLSLTGDLLFRFHASQGYLSEASASYNYFGRLDFPMGLFHYPWLFATNTLISLFYIPIFIAIAYLVIYKRKEFSKENTIILLWLIPLLLYLSFGSSSLSQYIPFRAVDRYTSIFTIPAILLLAVFMAEYLSKISRWIIPGFMVILLSASVLAVFIREDRNLLSGLREVSPFVERLDKEVYIDDRSLKALGYISEYTLGQKIEPYPKSLSELRGSYAVINRKMIENLIAADSRREFPEEIKNIPNSWIKVYADEESRIEVYKIN